MFTYPFVSCSSCGSGDQDIGNRVSAQSANIVRVTRDYELAWFLKH